MRRFVAWAAAAVMAGTLALVLAGCGPVYDTTYSYEAPPTGEGKLCANQCGQIEQLCKRNCTLERESCLAREREQARNDYEDYVRARRNSGAPVERDLDDFDRDYRCASSNVSMCESGCASDQRTCYATCGGKVTATTVCTAFCDQK